jgi:hypothetical protein
VQLGLKEYKEFKALLDLPEFKEYRGQPVLLGLKESKEFKALLEQLDLLVQWEIRDPLGTQDRLDKGLTTREFIVE